MAATNPGSNPDLGPHSAEEERPGRMLIALRGNVEEHQARAIKAISNELVGGNAKLQVLADLRSMGKVTNSARKAFTDGLGERPGGKVAVVGLNVIIRGLCKTAIRAVNLIKRDKIKIDFFKRIDDGHRWLDGG